MLNDTIDMFTANRKVGYHLTLSELRKLTPQEAFLLDKRIKKKLELLKEQLEKLEKTQNINVKIR